jgi:hypothetical protein
MLVMLLVGPVLVMPDVAVVLAGVIAALCLIAGLLAVIDKLVRMIAPRG